MEVVFVILSAAILGWRLYAWLFIDPLSKVDDSDRPNGTVKD